MSIQFCLYPTTMFTPAAGPELAMSASMLQNMGTVVEGIIVIDIDKVPMT